MVRIFSINNVIASVIGLPSAAVFILEDNLKVFQTLGITSEIVAWVILAMVFSIFMCQIFQLIFDPTKTVCRNSKQIDQKLLSIIEEPGNTCILSRNLSWADGFGIMNALSQKASNGDLTLFVNQENEASNTLKQAGANVILYNGAVPKCRFTIKGYGGAASRLYIAKANSPKNHVIHLHSDKDDLTLRLAEDLVRMLEAKA
jgi:hypothetical protein